MKSLFKHLAIRGIAVVLLLSFGLSVTTHATAYHHYSKPQHEKVFDLGIIPAPVKITEFEAKAVTLIVNAPKPDNTNYQLIKHDSLGLVNSHRNI